MITRCMNCNNPIALNKTAFAANGYLYCSKRCCSIDGNKNEEMEEIDRYTYGATTTIWPAYSEKSNVTTVFQDVYENGTKVCTDVIGFYFGEPSSEEDTLYAGHLQAVFV